MTNGTPIANKAETVKQTSEMFNDTKFTAHWQIKKCGKFQRGVIHAD